MLQKHSDRALEYLEGKKAMGYKWLTFDGITFPKKMPGLRLFASAIDATRYLNQVDFGRYKDLSIPGFGDSVYASIDNTIAEIKFNQTQKLGPVAPILSVARQLGELDYSFIKDTSPERQLLTLAAGGVALASRTTMIRPSEHIDGYVVVEQLVTKDRTMFNVEKSEVVEHHSGRNLTDALKAFAHQSSKASAGPLPISRKTMLFGKYKGTSFEYDPELYILRNSGIQIAASIFSKGKEVLSRPVDLNENHVHTQSFFVRYDSGQRLIETLDDRLIDVVLGAGIKSFGGDTFTPAIKGAMLGAIRDLTPAAQVRNLGIDDDRNNPGKRL